MRGCVSCERERLPPAGSVSLLPEAGVGERVRRERLCAGARRISKELVQHRCCYCPCGQKYGRQDFRALRALELVTLGSGGVKGRVGAMERAGTPCQRRLRRAVVNAGDCDAHCAHLDCLHWPYARAKKNHGVSALHTHPQTSLARKILAAITRESLAGSSAGCSAK